MVIPDILVERRYVPQWRKLMIDSGLRAVCSTPVRGLDGRVLASLAIYYDEPRDLEPASPELIEIGTHLAAIALEREQAEATLRRSRQQLRTLVDSSPNAVYMLDADFRIIEVNPTARPAFGNIPDLIGRDFDEVIHRLWHKDCADELVRRFRHTLETGESYSTPERIEKRLDRGVTECYEWRIDRIPLLGGRHGIACYFRDISRQVEARRSLEAADRQKDEFLAMLAHELRNPLAPITTASEFLSRNPVRDEGAAAAIAVIERQATQLTRLVDDLLDVSRITQGRIRLRRERIEIAKVVSQAIETVEPRMREKKHRILVTLPGNERLFVSGDFARLVQCLVNVLSNAVKYTDPHGEIVIRVQPNGSRAIIEVADSGAGVAPELLPQIFDLFTQGDRTLDRAEGGLGIGLSVAKRLIEMHGGDIVAPSPGVGRGSAFAISLPRDTVTEAVEPQADETKTEPYRVLIVDDNVDAANLLGSLLTMQGHVTEVAYSGPAAIGCVESFHPDVALLDLGLPEMNGFDLARRLRSMPRLDGIRLVALTGYGQAEDLERARAAGFDDHLVKPVDVATIERSFGKSASSRAGTARS